MRFLIALLAFALITLVLSSPLPDKQDSNDKDSDKNVESGLKSSSSSSSSSTGDISKTSTQSQSDSKAADSKAAESKAADSKAADSKAADSKAADSKAADSKAADSKAADSKAADPKATDSKAADSKAADSKAADSNGGASVLTSEPFSALQISEGTAGNAAEEAAAKFKGLDKGDLSKVSDADLKVIKGIHDTAEKAEVEGFNPALEKATGEEAKALQNGKIKNKVLKTSAAVLALEIKQAKGQNVDADKLAKEKAKVEKNTKLDAAAKGQASKSVK